MSQFEFNPSIGIQKNQIIAFTDQRHWVDLGENILFFGVSGIGYALIDQGVRI